MARLDELDHRGYRYYFLYTLNDYPAPLEPSVPPLEKRIHVFRELSDKLGPERVIWRYDPIIVANRTDKEFHCRAFGRLCQALHGKTQRVITSFLSPYAKTRRRLKPLEKDGWCFDFEAGGHSSVSCLLADMSEIAHRHGMDLRICSDDRDFSSEGVQPSRCIDGELIQRLWSLPGPWPQDKGQRPACGCTVAKDLGIADTCRHGCLYCYATISDKAAQNNQAKHDPLSPIMIGPLDTDPVVLATST